MIVVYEGNNIHQYAIAATNVYTLTCFMITLVTTVAVDKPRQLQYKVDHGEVPIRDWQEVV